MKKAAQHILIACAAALLLVTIGAARTVRAADAHKPPAEPNIIFFLVDDMGWQDTSVPFWTQATPLNKKFHTPNMEKLAAEGMKFTQAYASCVCSPSRVSLMTGLNAMRHRVTNWTLYKDKSPDVSNPDLIPPEWNWCGMSPELGLPRTVYAKPLPMFLRAAGYRTIHVGKAHFGAVGTIGEDPLKLGFDVNIAGHAAGGPGSYLSEDEYGNNKPGPWGVPGLKQYHHTGVFLTEALTREANKAVDQAVADKKPFYLYMAHYAVHVPYAADPRFYQKYIDAGLDKTEAEYAGLIEGMDKSLGDILANVDRHGLTDQTVVLFMSDNGGLSVHGRGGKPNTHNRPLSSGKGSAREGGIREPMIVRWPGVVKPKTTCDTPVIIEDFFPTILQLAGVTPPPHWDSSARGDESQPLNVQGIDGVSFVPLLQGDKNDYAINRSLYWHYPNCWGPKGPGIGSTSTIRHGDFKLIYYHDPAARPRYELFNIRDDIGETKNLADAKPDVRDRLATELGDHMRAVAAQMPTDKHTGKVIEYPSAKSTASVAALIPLPEKVEWQTGVFMLDPAAVICASGDAAKAEAETLAESLRPATGFALPVARKDSGAIRLELDPAAAPSMGQEGYALEVTDKKIRIRAAAPAGLFYGGQTLRQLLPSAIFANSKQPIAEWKIPCCRIEDRPRFGWRGFMLDSSRHFQPAEDIKHWLDRLAMHKLNVFHWHLVDDHGWRFESKKYPLLTQIGAWREQPPIGRYGGYYTQQEMRDVVAYAAKLHITVVPEIEMPGHSRAAVAAYPSLACGGTKTEVDHFFDFPMGATRFPSVPGNGVVCAGKEDTYGFFEDVLTEVMDIFPGTYIHCGGDEVGMGPWNGCKDCQAKCWAITSAPAAS